MESQVKSKERVADHGEVLTGKREVNAMLDLVKEETERIDSRFLEPACGTGNFLTEILRRKMSVVKKRYKKSRVEYERNAVLAVSSIYGIDILEDNVRDCRNRLFDIFNEEYTQLFKSRAREECRKAVKYILMLNIIHGDALSLKTVGVAPQPIVFSEWSFPFHDSRVKRRDFMFSELLPDDQSDSSQPDLFAPPEQLSDSGKKVFIPRELRSEAPVHFHRMGDVND